MMPYSNNEIVLGQNRDPTYTLLHVRNFLLWVPEHAGKLAKYTVFGMQYLHQFKTKLAPKDPEYLMEWRDASHPGYPGRFAVTEGSFVMLTGRTIRRGKIRDTNVYEEEPQNFIEILCGEKLGFMEAECLELLAMPL